ncbi:hypothetical protein Tco_1142294 [Tanacetum coccineum]|uniref:Uncharacterized protein n=1 Tax=Tanacetum coccineum TaxID=301880 RepID=A0ABQ4ZU12_9ASTR
MMKSIARKFPEEMADKSTEKLQEQEREQFTDKCLGTKPQPDEAKSIEEINLNVVTRSNGQQRHFSVLTSVLSIFDREDLNAVYQLEQTATGNRNIKSVNGQPEKMLAELAENVKEAAKQDN